WPTPKRASGGARRDGSPPPSWMKARRRSSGLENRPRKSRRDRIQSSKSRKSKPRLGYPVGASSCLVVRKGQERWGWEAEVVPIWCQDGAGGRPAPSRPPRRALTSWRALPQTGHATRSLTKLLLCVAIATFGAAAPGQGAGGDWLR